MLVVNAAMKAADFAHIEAGLAANVRLLRADHRALLALQGPRAAEVLSRHCPESVGLAFMQAATARFDGLACHISRSGYTGEDGFEISIRADRVERVARAAARRAGSQADRSRRAGFAAGSKPGSVSTATTSTRRRRPSRRVSPGRSASAAAPKAAFRAPTVSGSRSPTRPRAAASGSSWKARCRRARGPTSRPRKAFWSAASPRAASARRSAVRSPWAMSKPSSAAIGTPLDLVVRGKPMAAHVAALPFVPHRYHKESQSPLA